MMGIERFLVEIVRAKDDRFLGPFTVAQLISVIVLLVGITLIASRRKLETLSADGADVRR